MHRNSERTSTQDFTSLICESIFANLDPNRFKDRYLRTSLLSKFADPKPSLVKQRQDAALAKWLSVERRNTRTEMRLMLTDDSNIIWGAEVAKVLTRAKRTIRRLLGSEVPLDALYGSFSGGASTSRRRQPGTLLRKFSERPDVTQEAWDRVWPAIYREHDLWHVMNPKVLKPRFVRGNVMFTVPKNDLIDRVACKEPDLNLYLQKGAGDFIRQRLRHVGVDLNDQSVNRRLAREGSITGELATLDLSSASDSVTTQLVMELLPHDWFFHLDAIRCRETRLLDGTWHQNVMFSSMGNGFTFELESLLFYALAKAVAGIRGESGRVSVYGDDIIVPSCIARNVIQILGYTGFKTNPGKTFFTGNFRESCGGHYESGVDVTPFYIKRPVNTVPDLIRVLNQLRKWSKLSPDSTWCDSDWYSTWQSIATCVSDRRLFGGYDLASIETVASYTGKAYRYVELVDRSLPVEMMVGGYLEWQHNALTRMVPTELASAVSFHRGVYRVIKPRKHFAFNFGLQAPLFVEELSADG